MMRALGRGSLSSAMKLLVDVSWVAACAALGFIWIIAIISIIAMLGGGEVKAGILAKISISGGYELASWVIIGTIVCLGVMAISTILRKVFETLVEGDPFVPENAQRFGRISLYLAILELARMFVGPLITLVMRSMSPEKTGDEFQLDLEINLIVWAAIVVLAILSQVFEEGARLREEQKMTI